MSFGKDEQEEANQIAREELAFAKERHARWMEVYGPIEDNISRWAQGLSASTYAGKMAAQFQTQFKKSQENVRKTLAQRGLDGSNLEAFLMSNAELQKAQGLAGIHAGAEEHVANLQSQVLGRGQVTDQTNMQFRAQAGQNATQTFMSSANLSWKRINDIMTQMNVAGRTIK